MNIDDSINDTNVKIKESMKKIEELEENKPENETKQCVYDRKGYCKEGNSCKYFHAQEICSEYEKNGVCAKKECRKRHPRKCRYDQRSICHRGQSCRYLHEMRRTEMKSCDRREIPCLINYYCEFCGKSFCVNCTLEEAHTNNIYKAEPNSVNCSLIHKICTKELTSMKTWTGQPSWTA